jgi:NTP pyrophosphatase (non-canonical NTP hydrolase)
MHIKECVEKAYENAKEKGWHDKERSIGDLICLMHSELSEALEEHRDGRYPTEIYYNDNKPTKPEGIGVELADCIIRIFDFCGKYDIDLEKLIETKMKYNETRPQRHGGKTI